MAIEAVAAAPDLTPPPLTLEHALFLDFDGTLVAIAPTPSSIQVPADLPDLLTAVSDRLGGALAIVSGRPVRTLVHFLGSFAGLLIGQHGLERRSMDGRIVQDPPQPGLDAIRRRLSDFAKTHPGLNFEDKGVSVSLHYRQAPELEDACRQLARQAASDSGDQFRLLQGHGVVELLPTTAGKGHAVATCLVGPPFKGRVPVFVGDDTGDEPGFEAVNQRHGISIRVGAGESAARYRFESPDQVRAWLR
ncbi:MAG: trehalose-phosphatase [Aliidongia sp.]